MVPVDMAALDDLIRTLEAAAERAAGYPEYIVRRVVMPAGVILHDRDRRGRPFVWVANEVLSKLPMAPFTGSPLTALAGVPVFDAPLDV